MHLVQGILGDMFETQLDAPTADKELRATSIGFCISSLREFGGDLVWIPGPKGKLALFLVFDLLSQKCQLIATGNIFPSDSEISDF